MYENKLLDEILVQKLVHKYQLYLLILDCFQTSWKYFSLKDTCYNSIKTIEILKNKSNKKCTGSYRDNCRALFTIIIDLNGDTVS